MKRLLYAATAAFLGVYCHAQNFEPLKAKGEVPEDFTSGYFEKLREKERSISKSVSKKEHRTEMEFHQYNEYVLDNYLTSGKVLYGDEVTDYLSEVLDKVLENDNSGLRDELRIYAVRSGAFNAYSTNNGIIFVNLGLISELETEAQLAFVLSHEVVHYMEKHVKENYDFKEQLKKIRYSRKYDPEKIASNYYSFSKEHELEADELGYKYFFENSGYRLMAPYELMDIMVYAYLPYDNIPFDVNCMKTESFGILDNDLINHEANEISARDDVPDSLSSHPNIKVRTEEMEDYAAQSEEGADFLVSEDRFLSIRERCRYENLETYLRDGNYDRAIYQAFLLQQEHPDDPFLEEAITYATYATSVYKNYQKDMDEVSPEPKQEGELSRVRFILNNIDDVELNTLAVCKTYEYYKANPGDELAERMFKDAMWELTHYHLMELDDYPAKPAITQQTDSVLAVNEEPEKEETNRKKRRTSRKVKSLKSKSKNKNASYKYAFDAYLQDSLFVATFKDEMADMADFEDRLPQLMRKGRKNGKTLTLAQVRDPELLGVGEYLQYPEKKENVGGHGVNEAFIITPKFYSFKLTKGAIDYKKSSKKQKAYTTTLSKMSREKRVKTELYDYKYNNDNSAEFFNELQTLQLYYDEHLNHDNVSLVHYMSKHVKPIREKYEIDYLVFSGMISVNRLGTGGNIYGFYGNFFLSFAYPLAAPFLFGQYFIPSAESLQFMHVVNMKTGKDVMTKSNVGRHYQSQSVINTLIYDEFNKLSTQPKYK